MEIWVNKSEYIHHLTQNSHVIFPLFLVLFNQVVKVVSEVLEEIVLLVDLEAQDAI